MILYGAEPAESAALRRFLWSSQSSQKLIIPEILTME